MALTENHAYTAIQQTNARDFFEALATNPHPTLSGMTARELYDKEFQRFASIGDAKTLQQQWQGQLRHDPGNSPLTVSHSEEAALLLLSGLPMDEAILIFKNRLNRELEMQQKLLQLTVLSDNPESMRARVAENITAAERRLRQFYEALEGRRTSTADTY